MGRRPWTASETRLLRRHFGRVPVSLLATKLNRTPNAVWCRAHRLGMATRNITHSLAEIINSTGYNWKQLLKARDELGQVWVRHKQARGSRYLITNTQREELLRHLAKPGPKRTPQIYPWETSLGISRCLRCGSNEERHKALGLCERCSDRLRKKPSQYRQHKLLIQYWRLAKELQRPIHTVHPVEQLDSWDTLLNTSILKLRVIVVPTN